MTTERDYRLTLQVARYIGYQYNRGPGHPDLDVADMVAKLKQQEVPPLFIKVVTTVHRAESERRAQRKAREEAWLALPDPPMPPEVGGRQPLDRWMSNRLMRTLFEVPACASLDSLPFVKVHAAWKFYLYTGGSAVSSMTLKEFKRELRRYGYSLSKMDGVEVIRGVELRLP